MEAEKFIRQLGSDPSAGLASEERFRRQRQYGLNKLEEKRSFRPLLLFLGQFGDTMVLMLLAATLVSAVLGEYADALTIMTIVVLNAVLGFVQEFKAERSLEALQSFSAPRAQIICDGEVRSVPAEELVPGDIVFLKAGDRVPADVRIFASSSLEVEESPLTGETVPVPKSEDGEDCYAYMGCLVTRGRSMGVVVATGMNTRMGQIADMIHQAEQPPTPLQQRLSRLGNVLVAVCLVICLFVVIAGVLRGEQLYKMFMAGVSLAVAAIPEGLPAVVTLCLAIGLQRMLKRRAIARKLPAVETLGSATVICSDKTGTLTENKMTAERIYTGGSILAVTGKGYSLEGEILGAGKMPGHLNWLLTVGVVCNGANLKKRGEKTEILGDPTDGALLVLAAKQGLYKNRLLERLQVLREYPFDSKKKMMTTLVRDRDGTYFSLVKGAPEVVLPLCRRVAANAGTLPLTGEVLGQINSVCEEWASQAYRLLAVAWRASPAPYASQAQAESDLVFGGIIALNDPPRPEVPGAVRQCLQAGIRPVMITGDHKATAVAIARRIGLPFTAQGVVTGAELEEMDDRELERRIDSISICARVYPEHKMRIVRILKKKGHVVAMTGDGVNDAPAVKEANIGIAMGIAGTEVTKEAASLVLADDNFATIVSAVEEGRVIYGNIRKFIRFLLACNTGEVFTMFFAMLLGFPLPLRAIQILWVNLVTDGLPALALSMEPAGPGIMQAPPRPKDESILARGLGRNIFSTGLSIGVLTLITFVIGLSRGNLDYARTLALATLITVQLVFALECRRNDGDKAAPLFANLWIVAALAVSTGLLLAVLYIPQLQAVFATVAPSRSDWLIILGFSLLPFMLVQVLRRLARRLGL
ncbi:MAG: cation-translocating P-type ATPase [Bacillota bacterium]|jgi:Ca2+-transporting ATPase